MTVRPGLAGAVAALVATALVMPAAAGENPVERSRDAAGVLDFAGRVRVFWVDPVGRHETVVRVRAADGVVVVEGLRRIVAAGDDRLVSADSAGWHLVWHADPVPSDAPDMWRKYRVSYSPGPVVAGRLTRLVHVMSGGVVRERLLVDIGSGLILARDQYDARGALRRSVAFEELRLVPGRAVVPQPAADRSPRPLDGGVRGRAYRAPSVLAGGYVRLGAYRRGPAVQVVYSDGVYGLSLFEQRGRLGEVPGLARPVRIGDGRGWHLTWPGGDVVTWQAGDAVYTLVGEAPPEEVLAAARSVPPPSRAPLLERLRRACRGLLDLRA